MDITVFTVLVTDPNSRAVNVAVVADREQAADFLRYNYAEHLSSEESADQLTLDQLYVAMSDLTIEVEEHDVTGVQA